MSEIVPGQRWVVDTQPELGLGVVIATDRRSVTLAFPQAECERVYATEKAPLTRITFEVHDEIHLADGTVTTVQGVREQDGLVVYQTAEGQWLPEPALSGEIHVNQPFLRLLTGQLDAAKWFAFRRQLDAAMARSWRSRLGGLLGIRANLIAHQLWVAWSACEREQVRVLLADEVGLGKTIEAGMILSRMLRFDRVQRALILVPDALQVQWLVELVRRFSLLPSMYSGADHDFASAQIHLLPHSALEQGAEDALLQGEFDLVIVDEAHHVQPGSEAFSQLSALAQICPHWVLLTATPEQLGFASHFARLQLLDPAKFHDAAEFQALEQGYVALNQKLRAMPETRAELLAEFDLESTLNDDQMLDQILDCHGLGRVMFRNTRAAVAGFPQRIALPHELTDDQWDSKFEWLSQWALANKGEKALVICHHLDQVKDCEQYLWQKHGIDVALFHEEMDLVERDSAAAYFADEEGTSLLLCSEIGSEGRNFQFCQHLVCMDLPEHPDLLEQRIGRLDRIGQQGNVHIHIPYGPDSVTGQRLHWFHQVLQCVERQSPAAGAVHDEFRERVAQAPEDKKLLTAASKRREQLEADIQAGRDALLEMNSCRQPQADRLVERIQEVEAETPLQLVEQASDLLNFHFEASHGGAYSLMPADNMLVPTLPGIPAEGAEVTFDRALANSREDLLFLTWDAPFIVGLWEMLHHSDLGSASVALLPGKQLPPGQCLLEAGFDVIIQSPQNKHCLPFLQNLSIRALTLDVSDKDLSDALPEAAFEQTLRPVDKHLARRIIQSRKAELPQWYQRVEQFAQGRKEILVSAAVKEAKEFYQQELNRLQYLADKNPHVDPADIDSLSARRDAVVYALENHAHLQLSAVRLVVTTEP